MKKTKLLAIAAAFVAILSVGTANAAPHTPGGGHRHPTHVVTVVQNHHHHGPQHHHAPAPQPRHHHHHHHHSNAGNIFLATAILISAFM